MAKWILKILKDKTGGPTLYVCGMIFVLTALITLVIEVGGLLERHDYVLSIVQRSCNSAVEKNIMDKYRSDRILLLDKAGAEASFKQYITEFNNQTENKYGVTVVSVTAVSDTEENAISNGYTTIAPGITVKGNMKIPSMFGAYSLTVGYTAFATNYSIGDFAVPKN